MDVSFPARWQASGDKSGKLARAPDWRFGTRFDNRAGDAARGALFSIVKEEVGQGIFGQRVDQVCGARALFVHPHVKRPVAQK